MLDWADINRHWPPVSLNEDRNPVTGRQVERGINDILSHRDLDATNFRYDIALL